MKSVRTVTGTVSSAGDNTVIAAVANNRIKVQTICLITTSASAVTCTFKDGAATNKALWTIPLQALTGSISGVTSSAAGENFLFAGSTNTLLNLHLSSAQSVTYNITFWDDED